MPYKINWKDGTSIQISDSAFLSMPKAMERSIKEIYEIKDSTSSTPYVPPKVQIENNPFDTVYMKSMESGYSGLNDDEKKLFDSAYTNSEASKRMSLDEIHDLTDLHAEERKKWADNNNKSTVSKVIDGVIDEAKPLYKSVREVLANPASWVVGAGEYGLNRVFDVSKEDREKSLQDIQKEKLEEGKKGEGLTGMIADPINLVWPAAEIGTTIGKTVLGKVAPTVAPKIAEGLLKFAPESSLGKAALTIGKLAATDVAPQAGVSFAQSKLNDVDDFKAGINAGIGGFVGAFNPLFRPLSRYESEKFKEEALRRFPAENWIGSQARKSNVDADEFANYLTPEKKEAVLKGILEESKRTGNAPSYDLWKDYADKTRAEANEGYRSAASKSKEINDAEHAREAALRNENTVMGEAAIEGTKRVYQSKVNDIDNIIATSSGLSVKDKDALLKQKEALLEEIKDIQSKDEAVVGSTLFRDISKATGKELPTPAEYTLDELKSRMKGKIKASLASRTHSSIDNDAIDKFIEGRFKATAGSDKLIPISDLSYLKGDLQKGLYDSKLPVTKKVEDQRFMAAKANEALSDIWNEKLAAFEGKSYNELIGTGPSDKLKLAEALYERFRHQGVPTHSERVGAASDNLLGKLKNTILPGSPKTYKRVGDAYAEPVNLYKEYMKGPVESPISWGAKSYLRSLVPEAMPAYLTQDYIKEDNKRTGIYNDFIKEMDEKIKATKKK